MRAFFQSPIAWFALFCAALSAGLWDWSRRLPDCHWETTDSPSAGAAVAFAPATGSEPALPPDNSPGETPPTSPPAQAAATPPQPAPAPTPDPAATAAAVPTPEPSATPPPAAPPSDAALAGPLPTNPEPAPSAPPAAAVVPPAPLDLAEIARQPALWPRQVVLLVSVRFPVILNGVNVGNIQMPSGRAVLLRKVNLDGTVEIELQGSQTSHARVKAQATDLLARAQAVAASRKATAPAP